MTDPNNQQAAREWLPIESAPEATEVWVFAPHEDPQQFCASMIEGHSGPYWCPSEKLVADVMDYDIEPTHWQPLPAPPRPTQERSDEG